MRTAKLIGMVKLIGMMVAATVVVPGCQTTAPASLQPHAWKIAHSEVKNLTPLRESIFLQHRSFKERPFTSTVSFKTRDNEGRVIPFVSNRKGVVYSDNVRGQIAITYRYDSSELIARAFFAQAILGGDIKYNKPIYYRFLVDKYGRVEDVTLKGERNLEELLPKFARNNTPVENAKELIVLFPETAVTQNSQFIIHDTIGTIKGRAMYRGNRGILVDISVPGARNSVGTQIGHILLSEETGRIMYSKISMIIDNYQNRSGERFFLNGTYHSE